MNMRRKFFAILLVSIMLSGCLGQNADDIEFNGIEYRDPPDAPDFTLLDQHGEQFTLSDLQGKVVVVAFIYTSCPDICLAISANMYWAQTNLGEVSDDVVFVSVTIDPARDTVEHLYEWTESRGYNWTHLTAERPSTLLEVYSSWNVIVDNEHIAASVPPEGAMNRVVFLNTANETTIVDYLNSNLEVSDTVADLDNKARNSADVNFSTNGWTLMNWNHTSWAWQEASEGYLEQFATHDDHLAWVESGSNLSLLPVGADCNGHGWVMGDGSSAHCMCDDGYERPNGDYLACVPEGTTETEENNAHEEALGEYEIGHSTVTFVIDKQLKKRLAWTGTAWDLDQFVEDLQNLAAE